MKTVDGKCTRRLFLATRSTMLLPFSLLTRAGLCAGSQPVCVGPGRPRAILKTMLTGSTRLDQPSSTVETSASSFRFTLTGQAETRHSSERLTLLVLVSLGVVGKANAVRNQTCACRKETVRSRDCAKIAKNSRWEVPSCSANARTSLEKMAARDDS